MSPRLKKKVKIVDFINHKRSNPKRFKIDQNEKRVSINVYFALYVCLCRSEIVALVRNRSLTFLVIRTLHKQGPYGGQPVVKRTLIITPGSLVKVQWQRAMKHCGLSNGWLLIKQGP